MLAAMLLIGFSSDAIPLACYEARAARLLARQAAPEYVGLTEAQVEERLGKTSGRLPGVWAYRNLAPGPNTVVPATVLRFQQGKVVEATAGIEFVGCIITVPRR
jgi:hypothetical protein